MSNDSTLLQNIIQINTITKAFQKYHHICSFKNSLIIENILSSRKKAIKCIINQFKGKYPIIMKYHNIIIILAKQETVKLKKEELIKTVLTQRLNAANKIEKWYKASSFQKKVKEILHKMEKCYTIVSSITEAKDFYLEILEDHGRKRKYQSEYCPILHITAFYIPRAEIHNLIVKVHFIADGVLILDPKFPTGSEDDYHFFNQINFKKIISAENEEKEEKRRVVNSMCMTFNSTNKILKSVSSLDSLHQLQYGLSKYNKKFQSMAVLNIQVKSILKQRPAKRVPSTRKIGFGEVNYSY